MKIQYASDLHLEFIDNSRYLRDNPMTPVGDILVLAGDIGYLGDDTYSVHPFWDWVSTHFQETLVILGNHEFYSGADVGMARDGCVAEIRRNVRCYSNAVVTVGGVDFVMSTLWSRIFSKNELITRFSVNDFRRIVYRGEVLTVKAFHRLHEDALLFLREALGARKERPRVVVTHHVPSFQCSAKEFEHSPINGAFTVALDDVVRESGADYWVYGHSHRNMPEVRIGETRVVCNQLGYVRSGEHRTFDGAACFVV